MTATDRAAELGREHGERDARAWLKKYGPHSIGRIIAIDYLNGRTSHPTHWPQRSKENISTAFYFAKVDESGDERDVCVEEYASAYCAAVETTIREMAT